MDTIYNLKKRAKLLAAQKEVNAISPEEVGNLMDDTVDLMDEYNKNAVGLGIRKTYATTAAMQADATAPVGNDGKPIRFGQLVSVYDPNNREEADNGGIYAFQKPGWELATVAAANVGKVDISGIDELNSFKSLGVYDVFDKNRPVAEMIVSSDRMQHTIIQFMFSNYTVDDGTLNAHVDSIATIVYRIYNLNAPDLPGIPQNTWGPWQYSQSSPTFRKGALGIEWKYTYEADDKWRLLVEFSEIRLEFEDLTEEQKDSLKLKFSDLTTDDIARLQQPAIDMIDVLSNTNEIVAAAENLRIEAELLRVKAEQKREIDAQAAMKNEKSRTDAEIVRDKNEQTRDENELQRLAAEALRLEAESSRDTEFTRLKEESEAATADATVQARYAKQVGDTVKNGHITITEAAYNALVDAGTVNPETFYYIIEEEE